MISLSIITPYYNPPAHLFEQCVASVLQQPCDDYEWIIVDDGSDTPSHDSLMKLCGTHPKVRILSHAHEGAAGARNRGMAEARGTYLTFLDADDTVTPTFFTHGIETLENLKVDAAFGFLARVGGHSTLGVDAEGLETEVLEGTLLRLYTRVALAGERLDGIREAKKFAPYPIAPKIYRRECVQSLRFNTAMSIGEDTLFNLLALEQAQRIALVPEHWYNYVIHGESLSHTPSPELLLSQLSSFDSLNAIGRDHGWNHSDMGMRYAHSLLNHLRSLAPVTPRKELIDFTHAACKLDAACYLPSIDTSQYRISRSFAVLLHSLSHHCYGTVVALNEAKLAKDRLKFTFQQARAQ